MTASFIIDCSITMSWCFPDEATPATAAVQDRLAEETAVVPVLWFVEVANVLAIAERKGRHTPSKSAVFIAQLAAMNLEVESELGARAFEHVLPLCREHGLTAYDATYLDLAMRRSLPLATLDDDLRRAAEKAGIATLGK